MLEDLGNVAATSWVQELIDPNKDTYPLMSEYVADYSWYGLLDDLKEALLGFMAMNDLEESSFAGVTAQLQVFGRIGMAGAAAIIDMARNGFLYQLNTNKEMNDNKTSLFNDFPEDLYRTTIMCAVQEDPITRQSNTNGMERQRNTKQDRDKMNNREGLEKATDQFIQCLIYRQMWDSNWRWKTNSKVKKEFRYLKLNKEKESGLEENTQMRYKGLGRVEAKTTWYKNGKKNNIPELQDRLIEIINLTKYWYVPDEPPMKASQMIEMPIVGKLSNSVKNLDRKAKPKEIDFNKDAQNEWQWREDIGENNII